MATAIPENQARFSLDQVAALTGGQLLPGTSGADVVVGVTLDSRRLTPGRLFVALAGDRHDAHAFLGAAEAAGAFVLVRKGHPALSEHPSLRGVAVDDTLFALGELARAHRAAWPGRVVGITGSMGKTTTKRLMAAGLAGVGTRVWATPGNLNNRVGVPMTLFVLDERYDHAVIEMGTSEPGEIARLAAIAQPDVGVVTHVAIAHTAGLGTLEDVAVEKGALFAALAPHQVAVGCGDDEHVARQLDRSPALRKVRYGLGPGNLWRAQVVSLDASGTRIALERAPDERDPGAQLELRLRMIGDAAAENIAAVAAVLEALGFVAHHSFHALAAVEPEPGRLVPRPLAGERLVLDDTYNANPASTAMAIKTAARIASEGGRPLVVVLGDMRELGRSSLGEHRAVGSMLAGLKARLLITTGPEMRAAARAARERGVQVHETGSSEAAALAALALVRDRDVVLVKGSRSMAMERVVAALTGHADRATDGAHP
ncbi:MAG: UDP-N-acetylmuramoyl-tripeptide--D-alanyl-D-alanine ligase [Sandaracinaceae bacterium]|nr:UDP-N-acetylmuramoyl-tripeptide--D-alanyl-D-alanine ligase [Sandaracinaceae bacterium]